MKKLFYSVLMMAGLMLFLLNCTSDRDLDPKNEHTERMKIAQEDNPEASCEDLGGIEDQAVLDYLDNLNDNNGWFIDEVCENGDYAGHVDLYWCGEDYSYYGCYHPSVLDDMWQEASDLATSGIGPSTCAAFQRREPKFTLNWTYDPGFDCSASYSIKATITWYCCPTTVSNPDI